MTVTDVSMTRAVVIYRVKVILSRHLRVSLYLAKKLRNKENVVEEFVAYESGFLSTPDNSFIKKNYAAVKLKNCALLCKH